MPNLRPYFIYFDCWSSLFSSFHWQECEKAALLRLQQVLDLEMDQCAQHLNTIQSTKEVASAVVAALADAGDFPYSES